jgi:hypothetical protein
MAPLVATAQDPESARTPPRATAAVQDAAPPRAVPAPAAGDGLFEGYTIEMTISEMPSELLRVGASREGTTIGSTSAGKSPPTPEGSPTSTDHGRPNHPGVKVLAAPRVWVMPRESITVEMAVSQIFTYLESEGEGRYVARQSKPQKLGLKLAIKADPSPDDESVVLCRLECDTSALVGREPVKGLDLEVGMPIISSWSLKTTAAAKLHTPTEVVLPSGPNRACLLTVVANKHLPKAEDGSQVLPNPPKK